MAAPEKAETRKLATSLLEQIREGLKKDPKVFLAGEIRDRGDGMWLEIVYINVAPVNPIYDPDQLCYFMDGILPELKSPRAVSGAVKWAEETDFIIGNFCYNETIGSTVKEIDTTTVTSEPEILRKFGIPIGKSHKREEIPLERKIVLNIYPDTNIAQIVSEYQKGVREGKISSDKMLDELTVRFSTRQYQIIMSESGSSPARVLELLKKDRPFIY